MEPRTDLVLTVVRIGGLGALLWAIARQMQPDLVGWHWMAPAFAALAALGWLGWVAAPRLGAPAPVRWGLLALVAASGGCLTPFAPAAIAMVAIAALSAGMRFDVAPATGVAAVGFVALVLSVWVVGPSSPGNLVTEGGLASAAGLVAGASRRQYVIRAQQAEELLAERVRADLEQDRAVALAERNRIGREIHDVLAHSLGALSVQLDAADAVLEHDAGPAWARELVQEARRLAVEGLEETRQAVRALRDEPIALERAPRRARRS